nr:MAG TPA: hypothetical protein [Caudoviricetes sp.]
MGGGTKPMPARHGFLNIHPPPLEQPPRERGRGQWPTNQAG